MRVTEKYILLSVLLSVCFVSSVHAETFQSSVPVEFTFSSTLDVSVSGDMAISSLSPGSSAESNIINVTVSTNSMYGYNLSATVGNSTHTNPSFNNTNLNHTGGVKTFSSLSTSDSIAAISSADASSNGRWGYSFSLDSGSTWSNYSGLPLYSASGATIYNTSSPVDSKTIKFKIGAKASTAQAAGTYTNVINFTVVGSAEPKTIANSTYMQQVNSCPSELPVGTTASLMDRRDDKTYNVAKLPDGNCWMTSNLRIVGTVTAAQSNFTGSDFNVCAEDLANDSSYSVAECHDSNNATTGVWYNFASASAGTVTGLINTSDPTGDICPFGWRLPTQSEISGITSYKTQFSPVAGGRYHSEENKDTENGYWWASTAYDNDSRYNLRYNDDALGVHHLLDRNDGFYIRCILK